VSRFLEVERPGQDRLEALLALRTLEPPARHEAYPRVREALLVEVRRLDGLSLSQTEERSAAAALEWLAEEHDGQARLKMEFYLDRSSVRHKRLPERILVTAALGLGDYPTSESARETLWAALRDPGESPAVRSACLKSLQSHHPRDLEERILKLPLPPDDPWLRDLQGRLK
jgi:hypothetical protein